MLVKQVMASPKSYSIWEHRIWTITLGLDLEREYLAAMKAKKVAEKAAAALAKEENKDNTNTEATADGEKVDKEDESAPLMNMPGQEEAGEDD